MLGFALLVVGLIVVTLGAELLVRGAAALAVRMGLSPLFIGLTVVGFGTSSPELGASLTAALRGSGDIAVGNVVGSNIFNVAVILALAALVRPIRLAISSVRTDLGVVALVAAVPLLTIPLGGDLPRWLGGVLLLALVVYLVLAYRRTRTLPEADRAVAADEFSRTLEAPRTPRPRVWINVLLVVTGLAMLAGGSTLFVREAVGIARGLGVSELAIGLTIVAAGTSMPELVTTIVAAARRSQDLAVGNILGSNVFNMLGILGMTCLVQPQRVTRQTLALDTPMMLVVSLALAPLLWTGGRLSRGEGVGLLVAYGVYLTVLITLAPAWFPT